jgi:hypothetical protein
MPSNSLSTELSRQMAIKAAVVGTTNTPGWNYIKEIADKLVAAAVQEALDEENPQLGESKRLKAKAMQKGFGDLFVYIANIAQYDPTVPAENDAIEQEAFDAVQFN